MGKREGTECEHVLIYIFLTDDRCMINLNEEKKYKNIAFYIRSYISSYITFYIVSYMTFLKHSEHQHKTMIH